MAAKKKAENNEAMTKEKLAVLAAEAGSMFDSLEGETFAGLNILRLKEGEADGPFILTEILKNQKLGENKKMKPVDVYVTTKNKLAVRMPAAASFVSKAKESKLNIGDEFWVKRAEDYIAKKFGKNNCAAYILKITKRA